VKKQFLLLLIIVLSIFLCISLFVGCSRSKAVAPTPANNNVAEGGSSNLKEAAETTTAAQLLSESESSQQDQSKPGSDLPNIKPKIIKSAVLSIEVGKGTFDDSMVKITKIAESSGGYVSSTESYSNAEGKITSGRILIRIPSEKFDISINEIKKIGELKSINISGQDVTQEYVDLESRLKNYEAQEKVLLDLMNKSTSVKDSIEVQKELSNVQGEIEVIKGRMNYLNNMVSFSTIEITIAEPNVAPPVQGGGFLNAVKRGAETAIKVLNGLAFFIITISPLIVLAGIVLIIVWASIRARNKRRAKKTQ
jgi:hypothetical protein